jgi:protein-histidine N-methyltransferase
LPSLAIFQWLASSPQAGPVTLILADYNATVLQLVTLPNFIVSWALAHAVELPLVAEALASVEGELELTPEVLQAFQDYLASRKINLQFLSGGWSPEFVELVKTTQGALVTGRAKQKMFILGAETIYSPFALQSFTEVIFSLMGHQRSLGNNAEVVAAAKRMYFGVGGSLDDFVDKARGLGAVVDQLREETEGVRRGVVRCYLPA